MELTTLEALSARLHRLRTQLDAAGVGRNEPLSENHPLVQAATACEFMLPRPLTIASLSDTVDRKIGNVTVLLERAREHADLPEAAQVAADQEYMPTDETYGAEHQPQTPQQDSPRQQ